ncbi:MAG: MFS transporter [Verrucomicrobiaceae bacterium]|nr:MFS transporter [Verrucomicrobiaceae bacterium]
MSSPPPHHHEPRTVRRNFVCHCFEGGLYMGGMAFLSPDAVLPKMVDTLGGQFAVVAMMPVLMTAAFAISQLFSVPVVERLPRLKPWVLTFGSLQRLPYLVTGLLLLFGQSLGDKLLTIVVLTPVVSGLIGGIGVVAWMEMVTRMIPERRRASGWAARYIIQALIGIAAGPVIHWILTSRGGTDGYAMLHLIAFVFLALSFCSQMPMREHLAPPHVLPVPPQPYFAYLASLPRLLLTTPHLGKLVCARFTGMGYLMLLGFLTKHALDVTQRPEADEGFFVTFGQIGTILGSVLAGWWGNRSGGKVLLITSRVICIAVCCWASVVSSYAAFLAAFFAVGFGLFVDRVGDLTLAAELCPIGRRLTLQAILGLATGIALLTAGWLGGQIFSHTLSISAVAAAGAAMAVISIVILRRIPEPRHASMSESVYSAPSVGES